MTQRISFQDAPKGLLEGLMRSGAFMAKSTIDRKIFELIKFRASQINGCAYCLDMHFKDAVAMGETEQRLYSLSAWRECPYYTEQERAVLAFTEAVTNANRQEVEDEIFDKLTQYFSKSEIVELTLCAALINTWNRINKSFRTEPGGYVHGQHNG